MRVVALVVILVLVDLGYGTHYYTSKTDSKCLSNSLVKDIVTRFICPKYDPCGKVDCNCNGVCVDGKCQCDKGFKGPYCEDVALDCKNGGVVKKVDGVFKCKCPDKTGGDDCSLGVCDLPELNPCNDGVCVPSSDSATDVSCVCPPNTYEPFCVEHPCLLTPSPCKNDALCDKNVPSEEKYCICQPGSSGFYCQLRY